MEKIGIIDLGSNTARLVIVEMLGDGHFMVIDQLKESVRLGKDMERDGFLKPQRVAETIKTLKMFRRLCDAYEIERIIAIATAAVRRAKNQHSFLDEIVANTGIKLKVLSAEEEATYVYRGVINSMDIPKGLILEIGGGSSKIIYYNRRNLLNFETLPFGSVTLMDLFGGEGIAPEKLAEDIENFVLEQLSQISWLKTIDPDTRLIGCGGSFRNLCKIVKLKKKCQVPLIHNYDIFVEEFEDVYSTFKTLDQEKKKRIKGVSTLRSDLLPASFSIMHAFLKYMDFDKITTCSCGLREGIMFNYAVPLTVEKPIQDVLTYSLSTLVKYYNCNEKHCLKVADLSNQLFRQLRVLHKFPRQCLKILKIASMLHDAGSTIRYYDYQKHSAYIIMNSAIYGVSQRDIIIAALVAQTYKSDDLSMSDIIKYKEFISEADIEIIRKLGMILRIAESLDRSMSGSVVEIQCDILGDSVIMKTEANSDSSLEIKDALNAQDDFRRIFKKKIEIL